LGNWLEISETSPIYNINIVIYKAIFKTTQYTILQHYNTYGDLENINKIIVFVELVNNNHYQLIYIDCNYLNLNNNIIINKDQKIEPINYIKKEEIKDDIVDKMESTYFKI